MPGEAQLPCVVVIETNAVPAGTMLCNTTPVAPAGPPLRTVKVYVSVLEVVTEGLALIVMERSPAVPIFVMKESIDPLLFGWKGTAVGKFEDDVSPTI